MGFMRPDPLTTRNDLGVEAVSSTPEEMAAYMTQELARRGKVVKDTGVKLD